MGRSAYKFGTRQSPPPHELSAETDANEQCPTRVVGRTRTMFHNTLVVDSSIRTPGKSSKTAKRPAICMGLRPGELGGHQQCSITLWWLVRVRRAPQRTHAQRAVAVCPDWRPAGRQKAGAMPS